MSDDDDETRAEEARALDKAGVLVAVARSGAVARRDGALVSLCDEVMLKLDEGAGMVSRSMGQYRTDDGKFDRALALATIEAEHPTADIAAIGRRSDDFVSAYLQTIQRMRADQGREVRTELSARQAHVKRQRDPDSLRLASWMPKPTTKKGEP